MNQQYIITTEKIEGKIKNAKSKQNTKFYKNLSEEILESAFKKSISFKKCFELHKLAETSLSNIKIKLK